MNNKGTKQPRQAENRKTVGSGEWGVVIKTGLSLWTGWNRIKTFGTPATGVVSDAPSLIR